MTRHVYLLRALLVAALLTSTTSLFAADFPGLDTDGFRPATKAFIDGNGYDGHKPNDYIKSFKIGIK